jgi:murein L,D-transpeptidase YcbB/YkuD
MAKKIIKLTENDLRNIVKRVIQEQDENYNFNKAVQSFLIKKKITDSNNKPIEKDGSIGTLDNNSKSAQAISKYQSMIGVRPDGVFGNDTIEKMKTKFPNDYKLWLECKSEEGDLFDKGAHFFGLD